MVVCRAVVFLKSKQEKANKMEIAAWILFGIGMAGLIFTFVLGIYFYNHREVEEYNVGAINKKISTDLKRKKEG